MKRNLFRKNCNASKLTVERFHKTFKITLKTKENKNIGHGNISKDIEGKYDVRGSNNHSVEGAIYISTSLINLGYFISKLLHVIHIKILRSS